MEAEKPYIVLVNENSHYMDESERYEHGRFDNCAAAIAACKQIVDEFLEIGAGNGTPQERFHLYTTFGEDPFIVSRDPACTFSAWDYARERLGAPPRTGD
jgi:hypothetical protein